MSQSREIEALLLLVRAGIYKDAGVLSDFPKLRDDQWEGVYAHAKRQTVSGVVCDALSFLDEEKIPPYKLLLRWVARTHKIESAYAHMGKNLGYLIGLFRRSGVEPVLQKGHSVARFYPNPALRVCGDIDFCFTPERRAMADNIISVNGVSVRRSPDSSSSYCWNGTDVEHHTWLIQLHSPFHASALREVLGECSTMNVELLPGVKATVLSPLEDLLMINVHIMKHSFGVGIGLRQFCDYALAYVALMPQIGEEVYAKACRRLGIARWTDTLHRFINSYLANPVCLLPYISDYDSERAVRLLFDMVMDGGNFGHYRTEQLRGRWFHKMGTLLSFLRHASLWVRIAPAEALGIMMRLVRGQMI